MKSSSPQSTPVRFAPVLEITNLREALAIPHFATFKDQGGAGFLEYLIRASRGVSETELLEKVHQLLAAGADVNAGSPLAAALDADQFQVAHLLLERGADPNGTASFDRDFTAVHCSTIAAVRHDDEHLLLDVLEAGGDVNVRAIRTRETPLDLVVDHAMLCAFFLGHETSKKPSQTRVREVRQRMNRMATFIRHRGGKTSQALRYEKRFALDDPQETVAPVRLA